MTEPFTCPSCGWPQGRPHSTTEHICNNPFAAQRKGESALRPDTTMDTRASAVVSREAHEPANSPTQSLAASPFHHAHENGETVETCPICSPRPPLAAPQGQERDARDAAEWYDFNRPTDAKEGEDDGHDDRVLDDNGSRAAGDGDDTPHLTPDIAGLVERLRDHGNDLENLADSYVGQRQSRWFQNFADGFRKAADALERLNNLVGVQVAQGLYRDFCKANAELTAAQARNRKLLLQINDQNTALTAARAMIDAERKDVAHWFTELTAAKAEIADKERLLQNEERHHDDELTAAKAEIERLKKAYPFHAWSKERDALKAERDAYVADLLRVQDQVLAAKAEIDTLHHRLLKEGDQYVEEAKSYATEIARLRAALEKIMLNPSRCTAIAQAALRDE